MVLQWVRPFDCEINGSSSYWGWFNKWIEQLAILVQSDLVHGWLGPILRRVTIQVELILFHELSRFIWIRRPIHFLFLILNSFINFIFFKLLLFYTWMTWLMRLTSQRTKIIRVEHELSSNIYVPNWASPPLKYGRLSQELRHGQYIKRYGRMVYTWLGSQMFPIGLIS